MDWMVFDWIASEKADEIKQDIQGIGQNNARRQQQAIDSLITVQTPSDSQVIYSWQSPSRVYLTNINSMKVIIFGLTITGIAIFIGLIFDWIMAAVLVVLFIVISIFIFIKPPLIKISIAENGLYIDRLFFPWVVLGQFWVAEKLGFPILIIETKTSLRHLEIIVSKDNQAIVKEKISRFLLFSPREGKRIVDFFLERFMKLIQ